MGRRRTITGSAADSTAHTPSTVPVSSIAHNPRNPRDGYADIDELAASIQEVGILQPLGVVRYETFLTHYPEHEQEIGVCDWVALNGNRRLAAARSVDLPEVPVHVLDRLGRDNHLDESVLVENIHRATLPPLREAAALRLLVERHGSQRAAAKRIGKTDGFVSQRLSLLKLIDELRVALAAGELRVEDARKLGALPPEAQLAEWKRQNTLDVHAEPDPPESNGEVYAVKTDGRPAGARKSRAVSVRIGAPDKMAEQLQKHLDRDQLVALANLLLGRE